MKFVGDNDHGDAVPTQRNDGETVASLLYVISLIREAAGVNEKPMLSELPDAIRKLREERDDLKEIVALQGEVVKLAQRRHEERDEARRLYCKQMAEISRQQDVTEKWWAEEMGWDGLYPKESND